MLEKMMFFRQKTKKIGTCHGFPAVTCAGLSKKSDFFDSPGKELSVSERCPCYQCLFLKKTAVPARATSRTQAPTEDLHPDSSVFGAPVVETGAGAAVVSSTVGSVGAAVVTSAVVAALVVSGFVVTSSVVYSG